LANTFSLNFISGIFSKSKKLEANWINFSTIFLSIFSFKSLDKSLVVKSLLILVNFSKYPEFLNSLKAKFSTAYSPSLSKPVSLKFLSFCFNTSIFLRATLGSFIFSNWSICFLNGFAFLSISESEISIFW